CARITIGEDEYTTENFTETEWKQSSTIRIGGEEKGFIDVFYLEEKPVLDEGPFLTEERKLITAIAELIGSYIEEKQIRDMVVEEKNHRPEGRDDWEIILGLLIKTDPRGSLRITRRMIYHLYRIHNEEVANVISSICPMNGSEEDAEWCGINIPSPREDTKTLKRIQEEVFAIAKRSMSSEDISDLFHTWLKADKARPLLLSSQRQGISLTEITSELNRFWDMPEDARALTPEDEMSIRTALIRRFFTGRLEYLNIAKNYINVEDFVSLLKTTIGPPQGEGRLGGKISGVYLAEKIIQKEKENNEILDDISFAKSWYIASDTLTSLIRYNDLDDIVHIKYLDPTEVRQEQPFLEQLFKNSSFPPDLVRGLRRILRELGSKPIIVRSSSLLEDSFGAAFSGKYKSLFLVNTGTEEERLSAFINALTEVYASTFAPDPIEYRRERGLLDFVEEMGILVQEVVGARVGPYYIPAFAGIAFSHNEFRWSPRIRREDGIIRMVAGLGTRAVDRVGRDYPVLVSPNKPEIQVNALVDETIQYSQHNMDVINLEKGTLETVRSIDLIREYWDEYPQVTKIVSIHRDGILTPVPGILLDRDEADLIITFSKLIEKEKFIPQIKAVLALLQDRMGTPVDVEFAHDGKALHILQCRPQSHAMEIERIPIPKNIPPSRKIFSASKYVTTSHIDGIEYIVYVDPDAYETLTDRNEIYKVAHAVGALNRALPKRKFILMGPGRWGSRGDIKLGVPITYNDINNTSLLIEVARKKGGYLPDLSFGTHFFQDLVEANIHYLPLYPDEKGNVFNDKLLEMAPNRLGELLPKYKGQEGVLHVIQVSDIAQGGTLSVIMDGEANSALAYITPPDHWVWRMKKVEEIARALDTEVYCVQALYVFGSTKEATAGPASDIDLLIHFKGNEEQREALLSWLHEWSTRIAEENKGRTGVQVNGILDVHIITDEDIENKNSWATHIGSPYGAAKEIPLQHKRD
ncbi:MAG: nucleotidyltransferase domain-containing protein, partial [Thermoplasmata archaeon]|nr:nucleotidyltransferase domain-containing protein [Thermoplasmata archaeon]